MLAAVEVLNHKHSFSVLTKQIGGGDCEAPTELSSTAGGGGGSWMICGRNKRGEEKAE